MLPVAWCRSGCLQIRCEVCDGIVSLWRRIASGPPHRGPYGTPCVAVVSSPIAGERSTLRLSLYDSAEDSAKTRCPYIGGDAVLLSFTARHVRAVAHGLLGVSQGKDFVCSGDTPYYSWDCQSCDRPRPRARGYSIENLAGLYGQSPAPTRAGILLRRLDRVTQVGAN